MHNSQKHFSFNNLLEEVFNTSISDILGTDFMNQNPGVNITENDKAFNIMLAAPGLEKKDFNITVEGRYLLIEVSKEFEKEEHTTYKRKEFSYHKFFRKFPIPIDVAKDNIDAGYESGILNIVLPKSTDTQNKQTSIQIK